MADATISYKSKTAGRTVAGATYLSHVSDSEATAIKDILAGYQVANAWSAINVADDIITGDGSTIAGSQEAFATFRCADKTTLSVHLPFVKLDQTGADVAAAFGVLPDGSGTPITNSAGSPAVALLSCEFSNRHEAPGL